VATDEYWDDLIRRLDTGNVIPIISNSLRCDRIFDIDGEPEQEPTTERDIDGVGSTAPSPTASEVLAEIWAKKLGYPFPDRNRLASVAQYNLFEKCDAMPERAKAEYLAFLRSTLLSLVEKPP